MIKPSPLQLERYYVTDLEIHVRKEFVPPQELGELTAIANDELEIRSEGFERKDDLTRTMCRITVASRKEATRCPYDFSVTVVGFFVVKQGTKSEEKLVAVAEPSLLYSVAREVVLGQTERGPYPGVLLPVITFDPEITPAEKRGAQTAGAAR